ncbi:MAG TPA: ABC transporter substrate-binding protein [Methylomirabilota bacterium]|nr:ABC transporter substrate-binding protein [Methylomirabilota bacterium]
MRRREFLRAMRGVGIVGTAGLALPVSRASAQAQKVSLRLDFLPSGEYCGYYAAKEAGHWAKRGLDVEIRAGTGSLESCKLVALGREDFAISDASTMIKSRLEGMPLKMVGTHLARHPVSLFAKTSKGIKSPKDLAGKSVAMAPVGAPRSLLPPFLKMNGVDPGSTEIRFMAPGALMAAFLEDKADALVSYLVPWKALLESRGFEDGKNLVIFRWMDHGFQNLAGAGFIVSEETLAKRRDMVARFVPPIYQGVRQAMERQAEAVGYVHKYFPERNREVDLKICSLSLDFQLTDEAKKNKLGWVAREKVEWTQNVWFDLGEIKKKLPVEDYFTNDFLA